MNKDNFLRMQLAMFGGDSHTFESNLNKMIKFILFESSGSLSVPEIRQQLLKSYDLEFDEQEIVNAIEKKHSDIERTHESVKTVKHGANFITGEDKYSLTSQAQDKLKRNLDTNIEEAVISRYASKLKKENKTIDLSSFKSLLHSFLYGVFNSNKDTLLLFLNNQIDDTKIDESFDYSDEEKAILNDFLNWEDSQKDQLVFQTVSYCVEYCLLNVKKDYSSYQNIFAGKRFYLDTNVIMRLAGINNEERKEVLSAFIQKCKENRIELIYSNYTYQELTETIHRAVAEVKKLLNGYRPVEFRHWKYFSNKSTSLDIINLYDSWCKNSKNKYNDYDAFEKYLMKLIEEILSDFKKEDFVGYETRSPEEYKSLFEELKKYKLSKKPNVYDKSVAVDVNNYLHIKHQREKSGYSFTQIKDYLITTDGLLCSWGKEVLPGTTPIAVLPSVWYSLILKLKGRSNNDYKAFNLFLNLRFKANETAIDKGKREILYIVQNLEEPVEIKNKMLDEISNRLREEIPEVVKPEIIVEEAKKSVIQEQAQVLFEAQKAEMTDELQKSIEAQTVYKIAEQRASKKADNYRKTIRLYNIIKVIAGVIMIIAIVVLLIRCKCNVGLLLDKKCLGYTVEGWLNLFAIVVPLILWLFSPIMSIIEKNTSFETLNNKELEKLKKDLVKAE